MVKFYFISKLTFSIFRILVISYERLISINNLSNEILQNVMKYLTNQQLKQSCLRVNKQWNQCALQGFVLFFRKNFLLKFFFSLKLVLEHRSPISQIPN